MCVCVSVCLCVCVSVCVDCDMTTAGAKLVASWLAGNPPLQSLYIGGQWHAVLLKMHGTVDGVGLFCTADNPALGDDGLLTLAEGMRSNSNISAVGVFGALPEWGAERVADGGCGNVPVTSAHEAGCGMTVRSAAAWADVLRSSVALRRVHIGGAAVVEASHLSLETSNVTCVAACRRIPGRRRGDDTGRCSTGSRQA